MMTYKEGSKGAVVKQIQKAVGCYPDGIWGRLTTESVKAWQREHGLTPDGIAGPATLARMGIAAVTPAHTATAGSLDSVLSNGVTLKRSRRRIDEIIVHCTATPEGQPRTVEQIRAQHKAQGYSDIGYHYLVYLDGTLHLGRDADISGAHAEGHNSHSIGVCYVGGVEDRPDVPYNKLKAKDTRTARQRHTLMSLMADLRKLYPTARIIGHRDVDRKGKECPSFDAKSEYSII